jgi:hypothetical protein
MNSKYKAITKELNMDIASRFITPGIIFILTLIFGVWLSLVGKPYNGILINIHKLIALAGVIIIALRLSRMLKQADLQVLVILLVIVVGLCVIALFATGAIMAMGKLNHSIMLAIHNIALILMPVAMVVIVYLLAGRKL